MLGSKKRFDTLMFIVVLAISLVSGDWSHAQTLKIPFAGIFSARSIFRALATDCFVTSDSKVKKTFAAPDTYKADLLRSGPAAVSNRVFIFSELPGLPEKVSRNSGERWPEVRFWM
jgi:hypothetical protein